MTTPINNPPISAGNRTAVAHKDWIEDEVVVAVNSLAAETALVRVHKIEFTPSATGYYRLGYAPSILSARIRVFAAHNGKVQQDERIVGGEASTTTGANILALRCHTKGTSLIVGTTRVSSDSTNVFLDINVWDATDPAPIVVLVEAEGFVAETEPPFDPSAGATWSIANDPSAAWGIRSRLGFLSDSEAIQAPTLQAGRAGTTRGQLKSVRGSSTNTPGVWTPTSKGGTDYHVWATDAGYLRKHTSLPAADTDGGWVLPVPLLLPVEAALLPTSGAPAEGTVALAALGGIELPCLDFAGDAEEVAYWKLSNPAVLDGDCSVYVAWIPGAGASAGDGVAFSFRALCVTDNQNPDGALGSWGASFTDTVQTAGYVHVTPAGTFPLASPVTGGLVFAQMRRDVGHASDDMTEDARVVGILVQRG